MKKKLRFILLVLMLVLCGSILFRGYLYRNLVEYKVVGDRPEYTEMDEELKTNIQSIKDETSLDEIQDVIQSSHRLTAQSLQFRFAATERDPNKLIHTHIANCIGYSAFFSTVANALLEKNQLASEWSARAYVGHLYFMGFNIHQYTDHPYFVDHDFVILDNKKTGEVIAVDPSLYDYSGIRRVRNRN